MQARACPWGSTLCIERMVKHPIREYLFNFTITAIGMVVWFLLGYSLSVAAVSLENVGRTKKNFSPPRW